MRKLSVLAALAFALGGSTIYARACDMGAITAYVTGTVVANGCTGANCATDEPASAQQPADCTARGCARPESAAPKVADEPLAAPVTVADCGSGSC
jgi:hypothetical protein